MKISKFLPSNVAILLREQHPDAIKKIYIGDISNALKKKYKFLQYPVRIEHFDLRNGVEFVHGIFNNNHIIGKIKIFNNGVYCEAELPTEIISEYLEDVFDMARNEFGMTIEKIESPNQFFMSHVEVKCDPSLAQALRKFSKIGDSITSHLDSYGQKIPAFEAIRLAFHCDLSIVEGAKPSMFLFERRADQPFSAGMYYSAAPLKSKDHLDLLEELERIFVD